MVNKLHLIYTLVIAGLIIVSLSVLFFASEQLNSDLTFGATLLSIIIGALAIFMSAYQGITQSSMMTKLSESADRVDKSTKQLENIDINKLSTDLDFVKKKQEDLVPEVKELLRARPINSVEVSSEKLDINSLRGIIDKDIIFIKYMAAIIYAHENNLCILETRLFDAMTKAQKNPESLDGLSMTVGSVVSLRSILQGIEGIIFTDVKGENESGSYIAIRVKLPDDFYQLKTPLLERALNDLLEENKKEKIFEEN